MDVEVSTRRGRVRGRRDKDVAVFKGIPYAAAPDGPLRFRAPVAPEPWDGVRAALEFGTAPPQRPPAPGAPPVWRPGDGLDCLRVNVWSPGGSGLPVMVWIYGGGWAHGAPSMPQYDGSVLAASGVVVVTFGYRTGFEGFGHVPGRPDNRGLLDQIAALRWVQEEIAAFGGDPDVVTVFGQSAGAASAALLAAGGRTGGLLRRAVVQSLPGGLRTPGEALAVTRALAAAVGVAPTADALAALAPETLLGVPDEALTGGAPGGAFGPVVDGDLVAGPPWQGIGAAADLDLLAGSTREEFRGFPPPPPGAPADLAAVAGRFGLPPEAADAYHAAHPAPGQALTALMSDALVRVPTARTAEAHARAGGRTWLYDFAWRGPALGAAHGIDVPFVFGLPRTRYAARFLGSEPGEEFAALSAQVRAAWTSFAATGDPGWPRFTPQRPLTRVWDGAPADDGHPLGALRALWEGPS